MPYIKKSITRVLTAALCLTTISSGASRQALAQQRPKTADDEVLRVNAELVQTAITVIDKKGQFVDNLGRGQFQLLVDGQPRPISFFERVKAGSSREEQLATPGAANVPVTNPVAIAPTVRGRSIVFFIDDLHLSADSLNRTKQMFRHFLDSEMSSKDSVAIASASGQIGFLQQFTNNREVLTAALERLSPIPYTVRGYGSGSTRMSEYDALIIDSSKGDGTVLNYYIRECVVQSKMPKNIPDAQRAIAMTCETEARNSARGVLMQAANITQNTYASLESLMRFSAKAPGRKLAFFISDGFLMDTGAHGADLRGKLDNIIDAAQRAGVVVYTIDARGLVTDRVEVTQANARMDFGAAVGAVQAYQNALHALADETGGRALRNQNYFDRWVDKVLDETSNYYLLAWRPDKEAERTPKFRNVKIVVTDRPDLTVRAPRGYVTGPPPAAESAAVPAPQNVPADQKPKTAEADLMGALTDNYTTNSLPTKLSLTYLNTPRNETVLTTAIQISSHGLNYGEDGKQPATIKIAGIIFTDKRKVAASFKNQLNVNQLKAGQTDAGIIYNQHTPLAPGMYQVRVAARDEKSGRVGSAMQWVVIPDLARRELATSSVLLGGQVLESGSTTAGPQIQLSVDHRFSRLARLGYWMFIYNAKRDATGAPNLTVQTQVLSDGRVMLASPQRRLSQAGPDPDRIPFGEEMALQSLAPGIYDLRVTITDSIAGTSATQTIDIVVL